MNPVTASLTGNSITASGNATSIQFTASLSGPVPEPITVHYTTQVTGTDNAVPNTDFTSTTGTVQIAANTTSNTFNINIPADTTPQAAKTFHVAITGLDSATTGLVAISPTAGTAVGTINFSPPTVSISAATGLSGPTASTISFPVHLTGASDQQTILDYSTAINSGDTAVPGTDFNPATNAQLTIPPNTTDATIQIAIPVNATQSSTGKTFHVNISTDPASTSNVVLGTTSRLGTINSTPAVVITSETATLTSSAATTLSFPVSLVNQTNNTNTPLASNQDVTVQYRVFSESSDNAVGGASITTPGVDYQELDTLSGNPPTQALVIPAGSLSGTITVPIAAELPGNVNKTFHVDILSVSSGAFLGTPANYDCPWHDQRGRHPGNLLPSSRIRTWSSRPPLDKTCSSRCRSPRKAARQ